MKTKILLLSIAASLLLSCGSTNKVKKADTVYTVKNYDTCVNPIESYFIGQFNSKVFRHKDCLGIPDLLSVVWPGPPRESGELGAKFLAVLFAEKQTMGSSKGYTFTVSHLDTDTFILHGQNVNIAFFELSKKQLKSNK